MRKYASGLLSALAHLLAGIQLLAGVLKSMEGIGLPDGCLLGLK